MSDRANYDQETSTRLISGVKNNLPHLLPNLRLSAFEKRRALRRFGLEKPTDTPTSSIPMVAFPVGVEAVISNVATKLALALYYRHQLEPAGPNFWTEVRWTQAIDQATMRHWIDFANNLGAVEIGQRSNADMGNLFRYRWSGEEEGHSKIFASICQFGEGLTLFLIVTEEPYWSAPEQNDNAVRVYDWCSGKTPPAWTAEF